MKKLYRLTPTLHNNIWGGCKLKDYGKISPDDRIGESWELSFVPGDEARIAEGLTLTEAFPKQFGARAARGLRASPCLQNL